MHFFGFNIIRSKNGNSCIVSVDSLRYDCHLFLNWTNRWMLKRATEATDLGVAEQPSATWME